jgi:hypothetical protein
MARFAAKTASSSLLLFAFCVCVAAVARGDEPQDPLRAVYTAGPADKQAVLAEARERLQGLKERSKAATEATDWRQDPDFQWLLEHRIPGMLAVEEELEGRPGEPYLGALMDLTAALGNDRLSRHLPGLLARTYEPDARARVLRAMADAREAGCEAALERFLRACSEETPEALVCEAARGLGLSGREQHLPLLQGVTPLVRSDLGVMMLAAARYRCGEEQAAGVIAPVLTRKDAPRGLQQYAVGFLSRNSVPQAVEPLGHFAAECTDERLAMQALMALIKTTGFGVPSAARWVELTRQERGEEGGGAADRPAGSPQDEESRGLTSDERRELAEVILAWWADQPEARKRPRRHVSRSADALKMEDAPPR